MKKANNEITSKGFSSLFISFILSFRLCLHVVVINCYDKYYKNLISLNSVARHSISSMLHNEMSDKNNATFYKHLQYYAMETLETNCIKLSKTNGTIERLKSNTPIIIQYCSYFTYHK